MDSIRKRAEQRRPEIERERQENGDPIGVDGQDWNDFDSEGYTRCPVLCANYWWDRERRAFVR
jgi:hypothetical protein